MQIIYKGRKLKVTENLKQSFEKKAQRLARNFSDITTMEVIFSKDGAKQIVKVLLNLDGNVIIAEEGASDIFNAIDLVIDDLVKQIKRFKERQREKNRELEEAEEIIDTTEELEEENLVESRIVKSKRFAIKPMSDKEAVMQMELLKHNFFVYLNDKTEKVHVVYKRKDGTYGLIEPEF